MISYFILWYIYFSKLLENAVKTSILQVPFTTAKFSAWSGKIIRAKKPEPHSYSDITC